MCCIFTTLLLLGPRFGLAIWWLMQPARFALTFNTFIWPLLGLVFLPWATLMYVIVAPGGVTGLDWLWMAIALVFDIGSYTGGGYGNRKYVPGYNQR